jgi:hypothetical protein
VTIPPAEDGAREADELGDGLALRAPVAEGEQPAPDRPLARRAAGDAAAEVQHVAELLLGDPGQGDPLPVRADAKGLDDLPEPGRLEVPQVAGQQVPNPVLGVARLAAPPALPPMARRRTSPRVLTASRTTWNRSTAITAPGSIRRTAQAWTAHMPMPTTRTAPPQAGPAPASQGTPQPRASPGPPIPQARWPARPARRSPAVPPRRTAQTPYPEHDGPPRLSGELAPVARPKIAEAAGFPITATRRSRSRPPAATHGDARSSLKMINQDRDHCP